jgi:antirestriction protein ArdC
LSRSKACRKFITRKQQLHSTQSPASSAQKDFFAALVATIRHSGNRAFYSISNDATQMPPFNTFRDADSHYATLAHECTHCTGSKRRLDRDFGGHRFGSEGYAVEVLVMNSALYSRRIGTRLRTFLPAI